MYVYIYICIYIYIYVDGYSHILGNPSACKLIRSCFEISVASCSGGIHTTILFCQPRCEEVGPENEAPIFELYLRIRTGANVGMKNCKMSADRGMLRRDRRASANPSQCTVCAHTYVGMSGRSCHLLPTYRRNTPVFGFSTTPLGGNRKSASTSASAFRVTDRAVSEIIESCVGIVVANAV